MIAIVTKYHGPTDRRGARISARRGDHQPGDTVVWLPFNYAANSEERHRAAAVVFCDRHGWASDWLVAGEMRDGYVFCFGPDGASRPEAPAHD